ncbi:MAG: DegT/DnrJ/EryC1/StrS family aminotransferase [Chlamydiales bacterium]|nr:DegT/DnrJ/EryC1/StrS family aminotransferase [Chlamydiales bacterium]
MNEFLPYAKHHIDESDCEAMKQALLSGVITRGQTVTDFENAIADYCGALYAVAFNSGSTALKAACAAAEVSGADKFFTTPNSFVATAVCGVTSGVPPVFVDVDVETGNLDLDALAPNLVERKTRGRKIIIPVHYAGIPVDMQKLDSLVRDPETVIIEDAAAALGSFYDTYTRVGSCEWSDMTVFSFHPAKLITTGEGGMVTTNNPDLDRRLRAYRNNGIEREPERLSEYPGPWYYEVQSMSGNYNFTEFQAALGLSQLNRMEAFIQHKKQVITWYSRFLEAVPNIKLLKGLSEDLISPHLAVVLIDFDAIGISRGDFQNRLFDSNIGTQVHYIPIYRQPAFVKAFGNLSEYFPNMEQFYSQALSLPLSVDMTEAHVERVCHVLNDLITSKVS